MSTRDAAVRPRRAVVLIVDDGRRSEYALQTSPEIACGGSIGASLAHLVVDLVVFLARLAAWLRGLCGTRCELLAVIQLLLLDLLVVGNVSWVRHVRPFG